MELNFALLHSPRSDIFPQLVHYAFLIMWKNLVCAFSTYFIIKHMYSAAFLSLTLP